MSARSVSLTSVASLSEDDWDRSGTLITVVAPEPTPSSPIVFPTDTTPGRKTWYSQHSRDVSADGKCGKRTLSELLRLHSETGTNGNFSPEEASRIADVLGQWINASTSPYEPAYDEFFPRSGAQDDLSIPKRPGRIHLTLVNGRPRGRSESNASLLPSGTPSSRPAGSLLNPSS